MKRKTDILQIRAELQQAEQIYKRLKANNEKGKRDEIRYWYNKIRRLNKELIREENLL